MSKYQEQLKNPQWQKKRLEIFQRDNFTCQICLDTEETLQVHHKSYDAGKKAWEYGNDRLVTLCETCHSELTIHIKKHGVEEGFGLLKYRNGNLVTVVIYTNGNVLIKQNERWVAFSEKRSKKLVHFIINNWLSNG